MSVSRRSLADLGDAQLSALLRVGHAQERAHSLTRYPRVARPELVQMLRRAVIVGRRVEHLVIPANLVVGWVVPPPDVPVVRGLTVPGEGDNPTELYFAVRRVDPPELARTMLHELQHVHDAAIGLLARLGNLESERRAFRLEDHAAPYVTWIVRGA